MTIHAYKADGSYKLENDPETMKQLETLKAAVVEALAALTAYATEKQLEVSAEFAGLVGSYGDSLPFRFIPNAVKPADTPDDEWNDSSGGYDDVRGAWSTSTGG